MTDVLTLTDTFQRADGNFTAGNAQAISDSGYIWTGGGAHLPMIRDLHLTMTETAGSTGTGGGGYANVILQRTPQRIEVDFKLEAAIVGDSTGMDSAIVLQSSSTLANQTRMLHLYMDRDSWSFKTWYETDGGHKVISWGSWVTEWAIGPTYSIALDFYDNAVVVTTPESTIVMIDQEIKYIVGKHLTFQTSYSTDGNAPRMMVSRVKAIPAKRSRIYTG